MACCILMALVWGALFGAKAWLAGTYRRSSRAQGWRLMGSPCE